MGTPDTYYNADKSVSVQLKVGDASCMHYNIGDAVEEVPDGVYVGYEGVVCIIDSKVAGVFANVHDKWGGELNLEGVIDAQNPLVIAMNEMKTQLYKDKVEDNTQ